MSRSHRMRVDPIACRAHGLCAEMLPEMVALDEWGYPMIDRAAEVPTELRSRARAAARVCPTLALHLDRVEPATSPTAGT